MSLGQQTFPLYPDAIPNSKPAPDRERETVRPNGITVISDISVPTIAAFLPEKPNGTAVIIFPGGGYRINAIQHEGYDIARELNRWGVTAFVVKYRIPDDATMIRKEIGPLQDAQQALKVVREGASRWNVNPDRIGIMGFSAGGHLASTAAVRFSNPVIESEGVSLRPDFVVLGYPVVSFRDSIGHVGSRDNLLGKSASEEKVLEFSNERWVNADTPPTFLVHAGDDKGVPVGNSLIFYINLIKHNVPAELHIYERGGHGFGMNNPTTSDLWMERLRNWLTSRGLL